MAALPAEKRREALLYTDEAEVMLAKAAWAAGDRGAARERAERVLAALPEQKRDWDYGNVLHEMEILLGRVALEEGDLEKADLHLLRAAATPGSPQLDSFGPDWTLASDLLERGRREAVSTYVLRVEKFWESGRDQLQEWKRLLAAGQTPQFLPKRARELREDDTAKQRKDLGEPPPLAKPDGLVGVWESTARSKGGIGHVHEVSPDGKVVTHTVVMFEARYRIDGDKLMIEDADGSQTQPLGTLKADTWRIEVPEEGKPGEVRRVIEKRRVGTTSPGAPAIVGLWTYDHYVGHGMKAFERYGPDGWMRFRMVMPGGFAGTYESKGGQLTMTTSGGSVTSTFTITGDRLKLVTHDEEGEYRYAGKSAWYELPKPGK